MTPWDYWELSFIQFDRLTEDELALLDHVALLTQGSNNDGQAARLLYARDPRLQVPATVTTYTLADEKVDTSLRTPS